jgi:glycosyltransferase involved in cell wall biosynthesis
MRIAFVTAEYPPNIRGGAGHYAYRLTEAMAAKGHEVVIFTPQDCKGTTVPGIKISRSSMQGEKSTFRFWIDLPRAIRSEEEAGRFDIVHVNGLSYWFLRGLTRAPIILTAHHSVRDAANVSGLSIFQRTVKMGSEESVLMSMVEKKAVKRSQHIVSVSQFTKDRIVWHYGTKPAKITVIPDGIDQRKMPPPEIVEAERNNIGVSSPIILFVGRLDDPRKGLDVLLEAFAKVAQATTASLVVVGKGNVDEMKSKMDLAGMEGRIVFTGFISRERLNVLYAIADLCVVPSRLEGYGFTVADAMQAGCAVIASRVGAIPEVIGVEDELVGASDPDELSSRMIGLLLDPDKRAALGRENLRLSELMLSWDQVAEATIDVYESVRSGAKPK